MVFVPFSQPDLLSMQTQCRVRIIQNYSVLEELWEQAASIAHDTENIACIRGVVSQMQCLDFLFSLV